MVDNQSTTELSAPVLKRVLKGQLLSRWGRGRKVGA